MIRPPYDDVERDIPGIRADMPFDDRRHFEKFRLPPSNRHLTPWEIDVEFVSRKTAFNDFHERCLRGMEIYLGYQLSETEYAEMNARGQSPLVMNYYRDAVRSLIRYHTAKMPQFATVGREHGDNRISYVYSELLRMAWKNSNGKEQWKRAIRWLVNGGLAFIVWGMKRHGDYGMGDLRFEHWPTHQCLHDPNTRDPYYDDVDLWLLYKFVPLSDARRYWPDYYRELSRAIMQPEARSSRIGNDRRGAFPYIWKDGKPYVRIINAFVRSSVKTYIAKSKSRQVEFDYDPMDDPDFRKMYFRGEVELIETEKTAFDSALIAGRDFMIEPWATLRTDVSPVTSLIYEDMGGYNETAVAQPYGEAHHVEEINRTLNKAISTVIFHAQQTANPRMISRVGSIPEIASMRMAQARRAISPPGTNIQFSGDLPPEFASPQPLNQGMFELYQHLGSYIREIVGAHIYLSGKNEMAETLGAYLAQLENAREKAGDISDVIEGGMARSAKCGINLYQQFYSRDPRVLRIFDDAENRRIAKLEQIAASGDPNAQKMLEDLKNDPQSIVNSVADLMLDFQAVRYDLETVPASYAPSQKWAVYNMMLEAYKLGGIVDGTELRKHLPMDDMDREDLEGRMSQVSILRSQLEAAMRDIEQKNTLLRQFMKRVLEMTISVDLETDRAKREIAYNDFVNELKLQLTNFKANLKIQEAEEKSKAESPE